MYKICIFFETKSKRWKPVFFKEMPMKFEETEPICRHLLTTFHTEGFSLYEEARKYTETFL